MAIPRFKPEPCPFIGQPCEYVPMAHQMVRLEKEIERLRSVLMMWVKFFDEDGEEDIFAAEEAMEATRQVLNMGDEDGV